MMLKTMYKCKLTYKCFGILLFALMSCSSHKNELGYFNDIAKSGSGTLPTLAYSNTIEPESELVIIVKSEEPSASAEFNLPYVNPATPGTKEIGAQPQQQSYVVDDKGNIDFPKLGTLHVAGMTTYQLKEELTQRIGVYVKNPIVTVSQASYRIVVMGEVKSPQTVISHADRFSILDALAEAGDLTDFGMRDNVLVLRRTAENQIEYHRVDLGDSQLTKSPVFWLKNNDVVIVSPSDVKEDNAKYNQNNAYKLSVISTIVGMSSGIISLIIALAIK